MNLQCKKKVKKRMINFYFHEMMQEKKRSRYHEMFNTETIKSVLSMLSIDEPMDIRVLMEENKHQLNLVELLQSLREEGLVAIAVSGWILTHKGELYLN